MGLDINEARRSGKLCNLKDGKRILWNGHLCEGANLTPPRDDNFCLWTRCGKHDVPADQAHVEGSVEGGGVECRDCLIIGREKA